MRGRVFAVPALLCALTGAPAAEAKSVCHLLVDRKADATQAYVAPEGIAPNDPALDIRSADIASNGKQVTTVLRVTEFAKIGVTSPAGYAWYVYFSIDGQEFFTQAKAGPAGDSFSVGYVGAEGIRTALAKPGAKGTFVADRNEIRVSFAAAQLTELKPFRKGTRMYGLRALAARGAGPVVLQADEATGGKPYVDSTPSCVKTGS